MPEFEYAEWDGTQQFQSLSASEAFDKLSEFLLDHGLIDAIISRKEMKERLN